MIKPPASRWERLAAAAQRVGVSPRVLLRTIESGRADIRTQRLGARSLVHVAANDVDEFAARLNWGQQ